MSSPIPSINYEDMGDREPTPEELERYAGILEENEPVADELYDLDEVKKEAEEIRLQAELTEAYG